jgi:hypothetical protein
MESEAMTFEVPGRFLSAFIKMADACRQIDTTAEQLAALLLRAFRFWKPFSKGAA